MERKAGLAELSVQRGACVCVRLSLHEMNPNSLSPAQGWGTWAPPLGTGLGPRGQGAPLPVLAPPLGSGLRPCGAGWAIWGLGPWSGTSFSASGLTPLPGATPGAQVLGSALLGLPGGSDQDELFGAGLAFWTSTGHLALGSTLGQNSEN